MAHKYWSVPTHYTVGQTFITPGDAFKEAGLKLLRMCTENETSDRLNVLRVAVDVRERDDNGSDRVVRRYFLSLEPAGSHVAEAIEVINEEGKGIGWESRCDTCSWVGPFRAHKHAAANDGVTHQHNAVKHS